MDTGFHRTMFALRKRRDATCQSEWVRNLRSHGRLFPRTQESQLKIFVYAPMRRNSKVVSGLITSPFISKSGYTRKLIGPLSGSGSTTRSRPFVISNRFAGL